MSTIVDTFQIKDIPRDIQSKAFSDPTGEPVGDSAPKRTAKFIASIFQPIVDNSTDMRDFTNLEKLTVLESAVQSLKGFVSNVLIKMYGKGKATNETRISLQIAEADKHGIKLNLENLRFGSEQLKDKDEVLIGKFSDTVMGDKVHEGLKFKFHAKRFYEKGANFEDLADYINVCYESASLLDLALSDPLLGDDNLSGAIKQFLTSYVNNLFGIGDDIDPLA